MTTKERKYLTLPMTGRRPVRIAEDEWPLVASGRWDKHDGQIRAQANREWGIYINVRRHNDGPVLVTGGYDYSTNFEHEEQRAGVLIAHTNPADSDIADAIHAVRDTLIDRISEKDMHRHVVDVANECLGDLPAEEI